MRIVCISDTHGQHAAIRLPEGDLLIHAGDFTPDGQLADTARFMQWLDGQPFPHKVLISGNHDFLAEREPGLFRSLLPAGCIYLENEGAEIAGLRIWGSPITPWFHDWAFNRQPGPDIRRYWQAIPEGLDLLITHGPPYGIRDLNLEGSLAGCRDLNHELWRARPRAHVFGHIHEAYGITQVEEIRFINASQLDHRYQLANPPIVIDL
ncbi:MAG: metallophosphatase domain-containing protein [Bacteroidia bacterium]|nr:metallophosphatase domain-containing protein [Bacteroidia bacterium]